MAARVKSTLHVARRSSSPKPHFGLLKSSGKSLQSRTIIRDFIGSFFVHFSQEFLRKIKTGIVALEGSHFEGFAASIQAPTRDLRINVKISYF